ncbi:MAG: glycosyltransferase family 4 protein [Chromatiales bacterium]|nr:glycosyltransferase family 4 protein [Chromatiales bacterium]
MRVAVVTDRIPGTLGGAATIQEDVLAALLELAPGSGHQFRIAGPVQGPGQSTRELPANVSVIDTSELMRSRLSRALGAMAPGLAFAKRALGWRTALDRRLAGWGADIAWFLTPMYLATDLPYFYTVWDLQHRRQPWFPEVSSRGRWNLREAMYREAVQRAALLIVPNATAQQEIQSFYGVLPERCLRLAQPTPSFALDGAEPAPASASVASHLGREFVVYPAQFWPHKNHVTLLQALRIIRDRSGREIHALFPGSDAGNLAHVRSRTTQLDLDQQVHFPGFVSRTDLVHLYRNALALAFPSHFGPENLPPLEAMALGCPVIAADVPGIREQLGDAALLADPVDPEAWALAIMKLVEEPQTRTQLLAAGHARALSLTPAGYVRCVLAEIERFSRIRDCWPAT